MDCTVAVNFEQTHELPPYLPVSHATDFAGLSIQAFGHAGKMAKCLRHREDGLRLFADGLNASHASLSRLLTKFNFKFMFH